MKRKKIDAELPRFVAVIEQTFRHNRNVLKVLESYIETDDSALTRELRIVIADMKTGNYEIALSRFSKHINSIYLSETVRGLIAAARGEDTTQYFRTLNEKLSATEEANIKARAMKLPDKIKRLVIANLCSIGLIYAVVFLTVIISGLKEIFG